MPELYDYILGSVEFFMVSAHYRWGRRVKEERTEEQIKADIEELKKTSSEQIDMAMLDRRAYCLTNSIVAAEGALPVMEKQVAALEEMAREVKDTPYWVLNYQLYKHRIDEEKTQLERERAELAEITEKLKTYDFEKGRKKFDEELAELKEVEAEEKAGKNGKGDATALVAGWAEAADLADGKPEEPAVDIPDPDKEGGGDGGDTGGSPQSG